MSRLICRKCKSSIVAKDLTPKARHRSYVCPFCGTPVNAHKEKYFFVGVLTIIAVLVSNAFYSGFSKSGFYWVSESYKSLLVILVASIAIAYSAYKNSKYKPNPNLIEPRPWPLLTAISTITLILTVVNL